MPRSARDPRRPSPGSSSHFAPCPTPTSGADASATRWRGERARRRSAPSTGLWVPGSVRRFTAFATSRGSIPTSSVWWDPTVTRSGTLRRRTPGAAGPLSSSETRPCWRRMSVCPSSPTSGRRTWRREDRGRPWCPSRTDSSSRRTSGPGRSRTWEGWETSRGFPPGSPIGTWSLSTRARESPFWTQLRRWPPTGGCATTGTGSWPLGVRRTGISWSASWRIHSSGRRRPGPPVGSSSETPWSGSSPRSGASSRDGPRRGGRTSSPPWSTSRLGPWETPTAAGSSPGPSTRSSSREEAPTTPSSPMRSPGSWARWPSDRPTRSASIPTPGRRWPSPSLPGPT